MNLKYQHQLFIDGLPYLDTISTEGMLALDIETTGLDPLTETSQVTQVAMVDARDGSTVLDKKASLTDGVMFGLGREADSCPGALSKGSLHWVLRYNHYTKGLFYTYGELSGVPASKHVRVEKTTSCKMLVNHKDVGLESTSSEIWSVPADSEAPLTGVWMKELALYSDTLADEGALLTGLYDLLRDRNPVCLLGQNIIGFDCRFLQARWEHYRKQEDSGRSSTLIPESTNIVDTMWIARVLFLPALVSLKTVGALDDAGSSMLTYLLSRGRGGGPSSSLQDLRHALSAQGGEAHDAAGDCRTNIEVLEGMRSACSKYRVDIEGNSEAKSEFSRLSFLASVGTDRR